MRVSLNWVREYVDIDLPPEGLADRMTRAGLAVDNIERVGENEYRISMAVAGFGEKDLSIEVKENTLSIRGEKQAEVEQTTFLHRGIAGRSFERRFQLADHVVVKGASLENGLLHVDLVRELPEAMKPRTIPIATKADKPRVIDSKAA